MIQNLSKIYISCRVLVSSDSFYLRICIEDDLKQLGTECGPLLEERDLKQTGNFENSQNDGQDVAFPQMLSLGRAAVGVLRIEARTAKMANSRLHLKDMIQKRS